MPKFDLRKEAAAADAIIESLLGELRYVLETGDLRDSERNSADLRERAAKHLGYADYDAFEVSCESD